MRTLRVAVAMVAALAALAATTQANADPGDPGEPVAVHDRLPPRSDFPRELNPGVEKEVAQQADTVVRGRLVDLIVDANPFEVPSSMVDRYADGIIGNPDSVDPEKLAEFRAQIAPEAERAVKRILVIEKIAQEQSLAASDDDIDARVEEIAEANNTGAAQVYAELQKSGRLESLERELTEKAVFDFLIEQSEIIDAP